MRGKLLGVAVVGFALFACGGDDTGGGDDGGGGSSSNGNGSTSSTMQMSECSMPSDCMEIVCNCTNGPVNFQGCNVVNNIGVCATESNCESDFGACD